MADVFQYLAVVVAEVTEHVVALLRLLSDGDQAVGVAHEVHQTLEDLAPVKHEARGAAVDALQVLLCQRFPVKARDIRSLDLVPPIGDVIQYVVTRHGNGRAAEYLRLAGILHTEFIPLDAGFFYVDERGAFEFPEAPHGDVLRHFSSVHPKYVLLV